MAVFKDYSLRRSAKAAGAAIFALYLLWGCGSEKEERVEATPQPAVSPPPIPREFRGVWIPTVANTCWPSKPGLSASEQKAELLALLDRAAKLNQNAVILQIRPACDALYPSDIEPWSAYLTGEQGQAPSPYYDPLEFAVAEAHERGLELHAWFNPYRARSVKAAAPAAASHVTKLRPEWIRRYGSLLWLDPGEPEVQDYTIRVVLDVVKRYDIDAVHFDDYFYPYPEKDAAGKYLEFPDGPSWKRLGKNSGLSRSDWRRRNVDQFIQRVYQEIHDTKPHVKFGISPFGIWRPRHPPTIEGLDAFEALFADARKWLREGWCDYLAPQLYWPVDHPPTSFPVLLDWWTEQSLQGRHVFPGLNALKTSKEWPVSEISRQIKFTRTQPRAEGQILWNANAYMKNEAFEAELASNVFKEPALVPSFGWLDAVAPAPPVAKADASEDGYASASWSSTELEDAWLWVVQTQASGEWKTWLLPRAKTSLEFASPTEVIAVSAVDRSGNASPATVLQWEKPAMEQ